MDTRSRTAARVHEIAPFHVMEVQTAARALEAAGRTVVHMEIGEPDFPTPEPVLAAARKALEGGAIYYTSALGLPTLREAIAQHYFDRHGLHVSPDRIVVTAGSSAALLLTLALLINRDDAILLADPGYPCNRHFVRTLEGEAVGIPVGPESNYQLTAQLLEAAWTPRTRGTLIASPSNPTGTTVVARRNGAHRRRGRGSRWRSDRRRDLSRTVVRRRTEERTELVGPPVRHQQFLEILQHDRMAPGLAGRARAARARSGKARAESLHFAADLVAARRAGMLSNRRHSICWRCEGSNSRHGATSWCRRCANSDSGFRLRRPAASSCTRTARPSAWTASAFASRRSRPPASPSRPASISVAIAPTSTCVSPIRSRRTSCARVCERLAAWLPGLR